MGRKVIQFAQAAPDAALAGLNRLTGLKFSSWPESLVNPNPQVKLSRGSREPSTTNADEREKAQAETAVARAQRLSGK